MYFSLAVRVHFPGRDGDPSLSAPVTRIRTAEGATFGGMEIEMDMVPVRLPKFLI